MAEEKRRVEISFSEAEFAILEELSQGSKWSVTKIVYDAVFHAYFTAEAKKRHQAFHEILSQEPIDWAAEWKEMKEWLEQDWAWKIIKSYNQTQKPQE